MPTEKKKNKPRFPIFNRKKIEKLHQKNRNLRKKFIIYRFMVVNRLKAAVVAYEYLVGHPAGRDPNTNVILVKQGREPPIFTGWFMAWDPHMWANGKSYDQVRAEMGNDDLFKTIELKDISNNTPAAVQVIDGNQQRYLPYDQLKTIDPEQAFGIDITKKENHLIESEFEPVFGMTRAAFDAMPKWKQDNKKKAVGLF